MQLDKSRVEKEFTFVYMQAKLAIFCLCHVCGKNQTQQLISVSGYGNNFTDDMRFDWISTWLIEFQQ